MKIVILTLLYISITCKATVQGDAAGPPGNPNYYPYNYIANKSASCEYYQNSGTFECNYVPQYSETDDAGKMWPCETLNDPKKSWPAFQHGGNQGNQGGSALCSTQSTFDQGKCCLPSENCYPRNDFNWIISTCKGRNCADWGQWDDYRRINTELLPICTTAWSEAMKSCGIPQINNDPNWVPMGHPELWGNWTDSVYSCEVRTGIQYEHCKTSNDTNPLLVCQLVPIGDLQWCVHPYTDCEQTWRDTMKSCGISQIDNDPNWVPMGNTADWGNQYDDINECIANNDLNGYKCYSTQQPSSNQSLCQIGQVGNLYGCADQQLVEDTTEQRDQGSEVVVNYVASYTFNQDGSKWEKNKASSFNTYGLYPPYDTAQSRVGMTAEEAWLPLQAGGAAAWGWGWYPGGVQGVEAPAMLFILSTEKRHNMAWYLMNQATLNRGPAVLNSVCGAGDHPNTWACANSMELDILESSWTRTGYNDDGSYQTLYQTMSNQGNAGRALWPHIGAEMRGNGIGGFNTPCYTKEDVSVPQVTAVVVDKVGTYAYHMPASEVENIWPGISSKTASDTISQYKPTQTAMKVAPCGDPNEFCTVFTPHCPSSDPKYIQDGANFCFAPNDRGICGNYWVDNMVDTRQQWNNDKPLTLNNVKLPWNKGMECGSPQ